MYFLPEHLNTKEKASMSEDKPDTVKKSSLDAMVIDSAIRLAFVGLLAYWSLLLIGPFVLIVLWGVILAVTLYPIFSWLKARLGGRGSIAAALITLVFLAILIGPASLLGTIFADDLQGYSSEIEAGQVLVPPPNEAVKDWPLVGEDLYQFWSLASTNLDAALGRIQPQLKTLGAALLSAAAGVGLGFLQFAVSIIIAGFLFSPAIALTNGTKAFARRIASDRGNEFVDLSVATIRNVARGVIGVSLFQSLLGALAWLWRTSRVRASLPLACCSWESFRSPPAFRFSPLSFGPGRAWTRSAP
jgi:predicted PurR-regulated permease PerM